MGRKKILVVEDNLDNRCILVYRLRRLGDLEVIEAVDGAEAVEKVVAERPDLVFMDLKMPVVDGWEATKQIRMLEVGGDVPIIALTAQAMAGDEDKALRAGCDDYLAKPIVDPALIKRKVEYWLGRGRQGRVAPETEAVAS